MHFQSLVSGAATPGRLLAHLLLFLGLGLIRVWSAPVTVAFAEVERTAEESETVEIILELSEESWFEAEVTVAVSEASTAVEGEDYVFVLESGQEERENPLTFVPGEVRRSIRIELLNDLVSEGSTPETLILDIQAEGTTVVAPGDPQTFTLNIEDSGQLGVRFGEFLQVREEGELFEIPVELSGGFEDGVQVHFSVVGETAVPGDDIVLEGLQSTRSPYTIPSSGEGIIVLSSVNNTLDEADLRSFRVELDSANILDEETSLNVDSRHFRGILEDNDPLEVNFVDADGEYELTLPERTNLNLVIGLSAPTAETLSVPFTLSGSATEGDGSSADYDMPPSPIEIPAGANSLSFLVRLRNDGVVEEPEDFTITLGTPTLPGGQPQNVGPNNAFTVNIVESEDIRLNFGRVVEAGDDDSETVFEAATSHIIGESDGVYRLPIFLNERVTNPVSFTVQIIDGESTARGVDPAVFLDRQDWDYQATEGGFRVDPNVPTTLNIPTGTRATFIEFELNDDLEPVVGMDEALPDAFEPDETVVLRITDLDTTDQLVELGEATEFELTIRDFPNREITSLFSGLQPSGPPEFNPITGLFEVPYSLTFTEPLDPSQFRGYRSLRFEFSTSEVDRANPDLDARITDPRDPEEFRPFVYLYPNFHRLAYPSLIENEVLIPGVPRDPGDVFREENADTVVRYDISRRNVNLPRINDGLPTPTEYFDIDEPLDLVFEFTNVGRTEFDLDSIDPTVNPESFRITLSRQREQAAPIDENDPPVYLTPKRVFRDANGNTVINFRVPPELAADAENIQIDYWDGEGGWKTANPSQFESRGNEFFWIDSGPPKTDTPSKDVPLRLYRILGRD